MLPLPSGSRLDVQVDLDRVRVTAPPDLLGAGLVYQGLVAVALLAALIGTVQSEPWPRWLLVILMVGPLYLGLAGLAGRGLAGLVRWMARAPGPAVLTSLALGTLLLGGLVVLGAGLLSGAVVGLTSAAFYTALLYVLSRRRTTLHLDQRVLQVRSGRTRFELPTEALHPLAWTGRWLPVARVHDRDLPGLSGLTRADRAWLDTLLQDAAARRRAALRAADEDPAHLPAPPAALLDRLERR